MATAKIVIDPSCIVAPVNRNLFGSFVEHLGRCVYTGIYEPDHPTADTDGFRGDVLDLVKELGVSTIRYPGGNFVSGYKWEDGVGPKECRPRRLDLAWHSLETNEIGLDEFSTWVDKAGSELMLAINLGTRGVEEALDILDYSNIKSGTALSDARIANGHPEPHAVTMWCLGNEMDGPWQLGHRSAEDYGKIASQTARALRQVDPSLKLIACGSSNPRMPSFGSWERTVLEHTYEDVDYISCHAYYEESDGDLGSFLASGTNMDSFIDSVVATIDHVKAELRSERTVNISFDEWNVWYNKRYHAVDKITDPQEWPIAPRLLEDVYTVADAVVVGGLLISLLRHADRVTAASLAQLVNVIAPIMTEPAGDAWRQTIFYPFAQASKHAQGDVLRLNITSETYETKVYGEVDLVDGVATHDTATRTTSVFLVNRNSTGESTVVIDAGDLAKSANFSFTTLADSDVYAQNTLNDQNRVVPVQNDKIVVEGSEIRVTLPAVSWSVLVIS